MPIPKRGSPKVVLDTDNGSDDQKKPVIDLTVGGSVSADPTPSIDLDVSSSQRSDSSPSIDLTASLPSSSGTPSPTRVSLDMGTSGRGRGLPTRRRYQPPKQTRDDPKLPRALQPERRPPRSKPHEPFKGAITESGGNAAVLAAALESAKKADEQRRRKRLGQFGAVMGQLERLLKKIRALAGVSFVHDEVDEFMEKLTRATDLDPAQRSKTKLLERLGTSRDELDHLQMQVYLQMGIEVMNTQARLQPRGVRRLPPSDMETVQVYDGVPRPQHWDLKRGGARVSITQTVEVVRPRSALPTPNPPLPEDDAEPHPRIVYPKGGEYGGEYLVEDSSRDKTLEILCLGLALGFAQWMLDHDEQLQPIREENGGTLNLVELMEVYFHHLRQDLEELGTVDTDAESISTTSSELPANT